MKRDILEVERKFYCPENAGEIVKRIESLGYVFVGNSNERDMYFTDAAGQYVRDRTCLRIRSTINTSGKSFEFTFKPKSTVLGAGYAKVEENTPLRDDDARTTKIQELNEKGFFVYVDFMKERSIYTKRESGLTFNILFDRLDAVGNFLEFEILAHVDEASNLEESLDKLIKEFAGFNLQEANMPYRDFVAHALNENLLQNSENLVLPSDVAKNVDLRILEICKNAGFSLRFDDSEGVITPHMLSQFYDVNQLLLVALYAK